MKHTQRSRSLESLFLAGLCATLGAATGCGPAQQTEAPEVPPDLYRSKTSALHVEFSGVAGELREALLHRDLLVRVERVSKVLQQLDPEAAEQVLEVYETVWLDMGQTELVLLADWWARFDPHAAMEWAESDMRTAQTKVPFAVMRSWARHDPRAAIAKALAANPEDATVRATYEAAAIEGWEDSGKPGVVEYIRSLGPSMERQRAIRGFARRKVLREGIDASFEWADALADDDKLFKLNVLRRVASNAAKLDPEKAAGWAKKYEGTYYMRSLPQRVAMQWVKQDPIKAMAWLEGLETGRDQDEGVREAFRIWFRVDSDAATRWASEGQHARYKDEAVALLARRLQIGEPERGIELASRIVRDDLRVGTLIVIARSWGVQDEKAAVDWVKNESDLTEDEKHRALTYGERWRQGVVASIERRALIDAKSGKAQLEDFSDPDEEAPYDFTEIIGATDEEIEDAKDPKPPRS